MIDKNKQYTTRNGLPVRIYETDCGGKYSVHGAVFEGGVWCNFSWTSEGNLVAGQLNDFDLIEVKPRIRRTAADGVGSRSVYPDVVDAHKTRRQADECASPRRIACVEIEIDFEEGEGL